MGCGEDNLFSKRCLSRRIIFATAPLKIVMAKTAERCFVIGGGSIYKQMLPYCDTAYITKVHTVIPCDTWFPNLDEMEDWSLTETIQSGEENGIAYEMLLYKRK